MSGYKKFFVFFLSVLILVQLASSSWAITDISINTMPPFIYTDDGTPILYLNRGESRTYTLTAENPVGEIYWTLGYSVYDHESGQNYVNIIDYNTNSSDGSITLSPTIGNTVTISGTLLHDIYSANISAVDTSASQDELLMVSYIFTAQDRNFNPIVPTPNPQDDNKSTELNVGVIEPAPELSDEVIEQLANNISIDASEIHLLTSLDFSTETPPEPTDAMKEQVAKDNYEFAAKLNTINVSEDGWYVFKVTVSDDLVGTKVSDLRLYYADETDFNGNSARASFGIINGITGAFEISNFLGIELDTLPKQFLATMFLSASTSITVYIAKILMALLMGGCNLGIIGGGVILVGGLAVIKFFRKRK